MFKIVVVNLKTRVSSITGCDQEASAVAVWSSKGLATSAVSSCGHCLLKVQVILLFAQHDEAIA